jgi:DNA topoisomerase-1
MLANGKKTLIIVESPAKCGKIEGFLGPNFIVKASFGHIRDIPEGLKSINFNDNYTITYGIMDSKKKQVSELRKWFKECSEIMVAGDPDREGEAICFHVAVVLGLNPCNVKRIKFQEITKKAIQNAVSNPGLIDMSLVKSQEARRVLDLLVGFELSPLVSQFVGGHLSAGRCQSPAVRLVWERENEILSQDTTSNFTISVLLYPEINQKLNLTANFKKKYIDKTQVIDIFTKIQNEGFFKISNFQSKILEHAPPKPYTTSTIQQDCSSLISMSPTETMSILQKLYEAGKITYMRTDSVILSKEALDMIALEINTRYGAEYHQHREYKNKGANAQEAHEAIRPTHLDEYPIKNSEKEAWSARETRVYELVWKKTMACQMANQRIMRNTTTIEMYWNKPTTKYLDDQLECIIDQLEFDGWHKLYRKDELAEASVEADNNDTEDICQVSLEDMKKLTIEPKPKLLHKSALSKQSYSRSLCRYTEASLIKDLESKGIGRPSTYANIMETIIRTRNYVDIRDFPGTEKEVENIMLTSKNQIEIKKTKTVLGKEKKKLTISPLGENVIKFLVQQFDNIMNYDFTKSVEDDLDLICEKKASYAQIVDRVYKTFHPKVVQLKLSSPEVKNILGNKQSDIELGLYDNGNGIEELIILKNGPYGHYLSYCGENFGLKFIDANRRAKIVEQEDIEEAVNFIEEQISAKSAKIQAKSEAISVGKFEIRKGPYGLYFQHNKKNYGIGNRDLNALTEQDCIAIINSKKEWLANKSNSSQVSSQSQRNPFDEPKQTKSNDKTEIENQPKQKGRPKKQ